MCWPEICASNRASNWTSDRAINRAIKSAEFVNVDDSDHGLAMLIGRTSDLYLASVLQDAKVDMESPSVIVQLYGERALRRSNLSRPVVALSKESDKRAVHGGG